jgi:transcriptional regulator with XRE-family HTH domain
VSPEDAFEAALEHEYERGSNFRVALEAVGGSTRELAEALGVSMRTVQRWNAYESGSGAQARNPERSPQAGELRAMADAERQARALERLANMSEFEADEAELEDVSRSDEPEDAGTRHPYSVQKLDLRPTIDTYRSGAPMAAVGAAFADALAASYGLPATLHITSIDGLTLR